ncbi:oligopeptide/dipeptide ABC transporter ATP-binding protein [Haloferax sp. DFSO52]|uniref:oligopeptide/dipeptide ABC transporter ATP-binding protein n=1 Tax=Haloferax sp. DFSO52 TaxID=3388505 RepID=UPI003A867A06
MSTYSEHAEQNRPTSSTGTDNATEPKLSVRDLKKYYEVGGGLFSSSKTLKAVDGVSFDLEAGEVLGLAGESGCGKSTTALSLSLLTEPTDGEVYIDGVEYRDLSEKELRKEIQYVFQDPFGSSNPTHSIEQIVSEGPRNLMDLSNDELTERAHDALEQVGLNPVEFAHKYPHELSGGELQRVSIAAALSVNPEILVADEPTSMLDASNRGRVLSILRDVIEEREISVIYISHHLGVLRQISDRIAVMYLGRFIELGDTERVISNPQHPYTSALQSASLVPDPSYEIPEIQIKDEIQKPIDLPHGCNFQNRCPYKGERCSEDPTLKSMGEDHEAACFYPLGEMEDGR